MISMDKQYRTRDGRKVRVLCVDRVGNYPVVALMGTEESVNEQDTLLLRQEALIESQRELLQGALSTMTGEYHLYQGLCPDDIAGWDSTDPDCPACAVITAIRNHLEEQ